MKEIELLVIGGGIAGVGIAAVASARGLHVLVCERARCGGECSANSLRIIHGGLRYLQSLNFPRALQSLRAQAELLQSFPKNITPLRCIMPLEPNGFRSHLPVSIGASLYRALGRYAAPSLAGMFADSVEHGLAVVDPGALSAERMISALVPHGALVWHDAVMRRPSELVKFEIDRIVQAGGRVQELAVVRSVSRLAHGFRVEVEIDGLIEQIWAKAVVNAAGAGINSIVLSGLYKPFASMSWCYGVNALIRRSVHPTSALALRSQAGRLFFAVPRDLPGGNRITALGTGYIQASKVTPHPTTSDRFVHDFINEFLLTMKSDPISADEIVGIECGLLPCSAATLATSREPKLIGREQISVQGGYAEILTTKYTVYREQARRVVAAVLGDGRERKL